LISLESSKLQVSENSNLLLINGTNTFKEVVFVGEIGSTSNKVEVIASDIDY